MMSFLKDGDGLYSSTRLIMIVWIFTLSIVWAYTSIKSGVMCDIPITVDGMTALVLGLKLGQNVTENKTETKP